MYNELIQEVKDSHGTAMSPDFILRLTTALERARDSLSYTEMLRLELQQAMSREYVRSRSQAS